MNPNISANNIKYIIISENEECRKLFEKICSRVWNSLKLTYDPRNPFSVKVNMTQELLPIEDKRMKSILYEAIVEGFRMSGWIVKPKIENQEEIIYIQRHK